ncbi:MATE family efflux transporter [Sciscionella sediminilitoris]|uniref:MATE family efflux transporter n=1 Tax=Sciscionella sediminilitoris TaxID=1445613 RepID=UPI0004DF9B1C|nr:MATE family efflux transporter [Sciscionella sp. SE31]
MSETASSSAPVSARRVFGLAVPALGVLAAEPVYVLIDTAVVGHLGALPLAGLALGGTLLSVLTTQLTFLSYGTTSRTARLFGAGRRSDAVGEGVQASWLALIVGLLVLVLGELLAEPIALGLSGSERVAGEAADWLRIAVLGAPAILFTMAGNGWMRGVQDTMRPLRYVLIGNVLSAVGCVLLVYPAGLGLSGSALANVLGQYTGAALFLRALLAERVALRPVRAVIREQLRMGRDLVLRSAGFQACFLSATAVAARTSTEAVGAHQIVWQLWTFLSLVLDSLAIAAQSLVGAELGAGRAEGARAVGWRVTKYSTLFGILLGIVFAAASQVLPLAFTSDAGVLGAIPSAWWFFVALQPIAGIVFALDGVLLGAGDAAFLRTATLACAVLGYLPLIWISLALGWGLAGIWTGLTLFMVLRMLAVTLRARSGKWAVVGAPA